MAKGIVSSCFTVARGLLYSGHPNAGVIGQRYVDIESHFYHFGSAPARRGVAVLCAFCDQPALASLVGKCKKRCGRLPLLRAFKCRLVAGPFDIPNADRAKAVHFASGLGLVLCLCGIRRRMRNHCSCAETRN